MGRRATVCRRGGTVKCSLAVVATAFPLAAIGLLALAGGCGASRITAEPVYFPPPPAEPHVVHIKSFNGLRELVPVRIGLWDVLRGRALNPHVRTPAGIAHAAGHLYICDTDIGAVHDWDLASGKARSIGLTGDVVLGEPVAVAVDERGTIFVADTHRAEVVVFDAAGREVRRIKPPDRKVFRPVGLAARADKLYVADIVSHQFDVFSTRDGRHLGAFGGVGSALGRLYYPMGVALDGDGRIYVSDMMNARVQVFDGACKPLRSFGRPGNRYGDMGKPRHLAVGPDGTVFIADAEFENVHMFDREGRLLMLFGGSEDRPGGTPLPVGLAVAATLPATVSSLVPEDFAARYFVFVTNTIGTKRISLFAIK